MANQTHTEEFKQSVLATAKARGVVEASREHGVSRSTIYLWSLRDGVQFERRVRPPSPPERKPFWREAAAFAKVEGVGAATKKYGVSRPTVYAWIERLQKEPA